MAKRLLWHVTFFNTGIIYAFCSLQIQKITTIGFKEKISFKELRKIAKVKNERKLSGFNKIMLWINYIAIICLLLAEIAKHISPSLFWPMAFFGLGFPILYLIILLFLIYWLVQFKRTFIFSLAILIITLPTAFKFIQFNKQTSESVNSSLKLTSFNCMLFDLYNWKHNKETRAKMFEELLELNSDVYCFQEYYTSEEKGDFNNTDTLTELLKSPYIHVDYTTTLRELDHWGIATFSKYPIVNKGKIVFNTKKNNICIYTDIVKNTDTIRIYNVHLQSISFSKNDNKYLQEIKQGSDADNDIEKSKNILRRLKRAFVKRAEQVEAIKLHMNSCKYKYIICGDFNDTPASYAYYTFTKNLKDAFLEKGNGFGKTYAGPWPQFRIDYILFHKQFKCVKFIRADETYTDHYAITAYLQ